MESFNKKEGNECTRGLENSSRKSFMDLLIKSHKKFLSRWNDFGGEECRG